ncbi:MAG: hypothetical protein ACYTFI_13575 [Planctomycetota bacterium]
MICTVAMTAYLSIVLVVYCLPGSSGGDSGDPMLMLAYGTYMAEEHPSRADRFGQLATALDVYSRRVVVSREELRKYLGEPDSASMETADKETLTYTFQRKDAPTKWKVHVFLWKDGIKSMGYGPASADGSPDSSSPESSGDASRKSPAPDEPTGDD